MSIEQESYQVRFDWGLDGAAAIAADADVLVWADALVARAPVLDALPVAPVVIGASLVDAVAVARWIVDRQQRLGKRLAVAVVAAGESRPDATFRFAVEDFLAAGAVIDELARLGLDATSPEAAAAEAAYRGLDTAVAHLLTASVTARERPPTRESLRPQPELGTDAVTVLRGT